MAVTEAYIDCLRAFALLNSIRPATSLVPDNLDWILSNERFKDWQEGRPTSILLLCGHHGSGKTVVSQLLFQHFRKKKTESQIVAYFSFYGQDTRRNSETAFLASLVAQMLHAKPSIFKKIRRVYESMVENSCWTKEDLWILFRSVLRSLGSDVLLCVVNAIDDCIHPVAYFLDSLIGLTEKIGANAKFICTSTPCKEVLDAFTGWIDIDVESQPQRRSDMQNFVSRQVSALVLKQAVFSEFTAEMYKKLLGCNDYLQLTLALKQFENATFLSTPAAITAKMKSVEMDLESLIDATIHPDLPTWALKALSWILNVLRPLKADELAVAVALHDDQKSLSQVDGSILRDIIGDLSRVFGPLIRVHNQEITLVHRFARDIILRKYSSLVTSDGSTAITGEWEITRMCLVYLSMQGVIIAARMGLTSKSTLKKDRCRALIGYAVQYWPAHYRHIVEQDPHSGYILEKLRNRDLMQAWSIWSWELGNPMTKDKACLVKSIHLAAHFGFTDIVRLLQALIEQVEFKKDIEFALILAAQGGYSDTVQRLIDLGVDSSYSIMKALEEPCARGSDAVVDVLVGELQKRDTSTLTYPPVLLGKASKNGYYMVAKHLIEAGADIDAAYENFTPLQFATANGHEDVTILLLSKNPDVNASDADGSTPLHVASYIGNERLVILLVELDADINKPDKFGCTPLYLAAHQKKVNVVRILLDFGADTRTRSQSQETALHLASEDGCQDIVDMILQKGVDVDQGDSSQCTALHLASRKGHRGVCQALLDHDADVSNTDSDGKTALYYASRNGHFDIASLLLTKGADINAHEAPLYQAIIAGHKSLVTLLLDAGADMLGKNSDGYMALHAAVEAGHADIVQLLLDRKAPIDAVDNIDNTALHYAVIRGGKEIVSILIQRGAPLDLKNLNSDTPLIIAVFTGAVDIVRELIDHNADLTVVDASGWNLLQLAAYHNLVVIMDILVNERGIDVNIRSEDGKTALHQPMNERSARWLLSNSANVDATSDNDITPLMMMASYGNLEVTQLLLDAGANVNATDCQGCSPLHFAARIYRSDVLDILLNAGSKPDAVDHIGRTPLQEAAGTGQNSSVARLLASKADINHTDSYGITALQLAAITGHEEMTRFLIEHEVSIELRNKDGDTALLLAVYGGFKEITTILLDAGANIEVINKIGFTPLLLAVEKEQKDVVSLLLYRGANINAQALDLSSAAHIVVSKKYGVENYEAEENEAILKILMDSEAEMNLQDNQGCIPLHRAMVRSDPEFIQTLLEGGCKAEAVDTQGRTLIHYAVNKWPFSKLLTLITRVLRLRGSRPKELNAPDNDGWTPLHWACRGSEAKIIRLLSAAGADHLNPCHRGWTPRQIAIFHDQKNLRPHLGIAEPERGGKQLEMPFTPVLPDFPLLLQQETELKPGKRNRGFFCDGCGNVSCIHFLEILFIVDPFAPCAVPRKDINSYTLSHSPVH